MRIVSKAGEMPARLIREPRELQKLLDPTRWKILKELAKEPDYPSRLAERIGMDEQKVYYHINQLRRLGAITVVKTEEKQGAVARYYKAKDKAYAIALVDEWRKLTKKHVDIPSLLAPFFSDGVFDAKIIVGSPDPHGPHHARARDTHFVSDLCLYLGTLSTSVKPSVLLDTDTRQNDLEGNIIVVGGPVTNMITARINDELPIRIETGDVWTIYSEKTGERYHEHNGLIVLTKNPWNENKHMLVVAGRSRAGTRAAILAIMSGTDLKGENVVEGLDTDGDGVIDSFKVLE
ncbi:MAG: S-layer protein [Candidatus Diapherotrites archaeon]|nr:S-layer protein [Candidatus Diapherotrites archaeon]